MVKPAWIIISELLVQCGVKRWTLKNEIGCLKIKDIEILSIAHYIAEMMKGEWLLLASISCGSIKPSPIIDARGRSTNWKEPKKRETSEAAHGADKNKHKEETQIDIVTSTFSHRIHPSPLSSSPLLPPQLSLSLSLSFSHSLILFIFFPLHSATNNFIYK